MGGEWGVQQGMPMGGDLHGIPEGESNHHWGVGGIEGGSRSRQTLVLIPHPVTTFVAWEL